MDLERCVHCKRSLRSLQLHLTKSECGRKERPAVRKRPRERSRASTEGDDDDSDSGKSSSEDDTSSSKDDDENEDDDDPDEEEEAEENASAVIVVIIILYHESLMVLEDFLTSTFLLTERSSRVYHGFHGLHTLFRFSRGFTGLDH
jgi:hypothetical protein